MNEKIKTFEYTIGDIFELERGHALVDWDSTQVTTQKKSNSTRI